jgi:RNA polymerase sigma factor (sigma-70 family)
LRRARADRFARLRAMEIEYIPSPEFNRPELEREILRPWPAAIDGRTTTPPPDTPPYLAALYGIPLLTKEQEHHLFRQMHFHKALASRLQQRLRRGRASVAIADEMERHLAEAERIRNAIVQANLRLVVSIAKTLVDNANSLDELISEGNMPLIRAAEIFDFTRGVRFSTYATWAVRNCLFRLTPKNRRQQRRFFTGAADALEQWRDRRETVGGSERRWKNLQRQVSHLLDELAPRERMIVAARFGLDSEPRTQRFHEIAGRLDLSTERVRQLLSRALGRLRDVAEPTLWDLA